MERTENKNWKKVLDSIYTSAGWYSGGITDIIIRRHYIKGNAPNNPLAVFTDISESEMGLCIRFLQNNGLVESGNDWILTAKGFDVATQNEKIESDKHFQQCMIWSMFVATTISIVSLVVSLVIK